MHILCNVRVLFLSKNEDLLLITCVLVHNKTSYIAFKNIRYITTRYMFNITGTSV